MSDPQPQDTSVNTRLDTLEKMFASRYTYIKEEVVGFWPKANSAWQWVHSELYHWIDHGKQICYGLAALGIFVALMKLVGLA